MHDSSAPPPNQTTFLPFPLALQGSIAAAGMHRVLGIVAMQVNKQVAVGLYEVQNIPGCRAGQGWHGCCASVLGCCRAV